MTDFILGPDDDVKGGTSTDDLIQGNGGNDTLFGLLGDDELQGNSGRDILKGGTGDDLLSGGDGRDILKGGADNDTLFGGAGRDVLRGGAGIDFLNGNDGNATLTGGADADNFQVDLGAGRVVITDFTIGEDTLLIDSRFFPDMTIDDILTEFGSSSGGDSAIDLSQNGDDAPRLILLGVDNAFDLAGDIVLI